MSEKYLNIPEKIVAGYRTISYPKEKIDGLIYLTYLTKEGKIAKEKSWNGWRSKSIEPKEFDNSPIEGISIVGSAGNCKSGWNFRQAYCQVKDPRGFEVQITLDNLLWILQMSSYIIEDNIGTFQSKFVYAWDGTQLVLCPIESDDFKYTKEIESSKQYQPKECVPGHWYKRPNDLYPSLFIGGLKSLNYSGLQRTSYTMKKSSHVLTPKIEKKYVFKTNYDFDEKPASIKGDLYVEVFDKEPLTQEEIDSYTKAFYSRYCVDNELHGKIKEIKSISTNRNDKLSNLISSFVNMKTPDFINEQHSSKDCYYIFDADQFKNHRYKSKLVYWDKENNSFTTGYLYVSFMVDGYKWSDYYNRNKQWRIGSREYNETVAEEKQRLYNKFMSQLVKRVYFEPSFRIRVSDDHKAIIADEHCGLPENYNMYRSYNRNEYVSLDYYDMIKRGELMIINDTDNLIVTCEDEFGEIKIRKSWDATYVI